MKLRSILFFLFLFGVLGYMRERFFEHLNIIMFGAYRNVDEYAAIHLTMPAIMTPFSKMSYATLYYSKYVYTLIWVIVFFLISYFTIKKLGSGKKLLKFLAYSYLLLLILAGISMVIGYFINGTLKNDEYTFSRWLLGIAQSPIICLILLASDKLYSKSITV